MLLVLRQLKRSYFDRREFRKYLLYALGETALIVLGIIIALRIDNWNSERIDEQALRSSLATIARNIESDLKSIATIEASRLQTYELSLRWQYFHNQARRDSATVEQVLFASSVYDRTLERHHFIANTTGYDALKNSGVLSRLHGRGIETLLYDYYDTVNRIDLMERDYNEQLSEFRLAVTQTWPPGLEKWEFTTADVLSPGRFATQQPKLITLLTGTSMNALLDLPRFATDLLFEYEKLQAYGGEFVRLASIEQLDLDDAALNRLGAIHDPASNYGNPDLIVNGALSWHSYHVINSDANDPSLFGEAVSGRTEIPFTHDSFRSRGDHIEFTLEGGTEWAGIWLKTGADILSSTPRDYTEFDTLLVEMKGDKGGEIVTLNIEDSEDPADGTSTRIPVELSDQWQVYEFELADFASADFTIISVPLGFVFFEEPVSFAIRNARYTKKND